MSDDEANPLSQVDGRGSVGIISARGRFLKVPEAEAVAWEVMEAQAAVYFP